MKTNLTNLIHILIEEEENFSIYECELKEYAYNISNLELNGKLNAIEDYTENFTENLKKYEETQEKITKIKSVIAQKNNSYQLSDGRTLQEALADNSNLKKMKNLYNHLINQKNIKKRITNENDTYFECKTVSFDIKTIKEKYETIKTKIRETDFEISKLNSIEFDVVF